MLVGSDDVAVPELAPARAGHGKPQPAVRVGAHLLQGRAGGRVRLHRLLGQSGYACEADTKGGKGMPPRSLNSYSSRPAECSSR